MKFVFGMKYYFTQSVKGSFTPLLRSVAPLIKQVQVPVQCTVSGQKFGIRLFHDVALKNLKIALISIFE